MPMSVTLELVAHGGPRGSQIPREVADLAHATGRASRHGRLTDSVGAPDEMGIFTICTVGATVAWEGAVFTISDVRRGASRRNMRILAIGDGRYVERETGLRRWEGAIPEPGAELWCWMSHDATQGTGSPVYGPPPENAEDLRPNARGFSPFCLARRRSEADSYIAAARRDYALGAWGRPWDAEMRLRDAEADYLRSVEDIERDGSVETAS